MFPGARDLRRVLPRRGDYLRRDLAQILGVVVHHSAGGHMDWLSERIAQYHLERGYPAIAYHFTVHFGGKVDWCLDLEEVAYHADGSPRIQGVGVYNWRNVGLCLVGDFMDGRRPTPAQLAAGRYLIGRLQVVLGRELEVVGHQDLAATACPGSTWPEWGQFFASF